jgi:4-hydroxy-tetrahydrodipicolinate synthase
MTDIAPGAWAASLTPLNADLSIDTEAYLAHVRRLLGGGCDGVAALGTTGEANSFSLAERLALIETLGAAGLPRERLMIGVGCCAQPDTVALTRAALAAGYTNVLMLPPFYYKVVTEDGIFHAYANAIEAVNDPRLRVIIYDFPQMTGLKMSTEFLARLASAFKGVVVGVKNSSGDWPAMEAALKALPGFQVFAGSEQFLLPTLRAGGPGCVSATANVTYGALAQLVANWKNADADQRQDDITRTRLTLQGFPAIPALKEIMAHVTGRAEWRRLRTPLLNLSQDDASKLIEQANAAGVLEALRAA